MAKVERTPLSTTIAMGESIGYGQGKNTVPQVLLYAPQACWGQNHRCWRQFLIAIGIAALGAFANYGLDFGESSQFCVNCGARSTIQHLQWYGIGGSYSRKVIEGPISRLIQEYDQAPCIHRWRFGWGSGGDAVFRYTADGANGGKATRVQILEKLPCLPTILNVEKRDKPGFPAILRARLVQGQGDADAMFADLYTRAKMLECHLARASAE